MKLVFATHNKNKLIEVKAILPKHIEILGLEDIGCHEEIPETADTIEGNAILKANYISQHYNYDCFADDTGLEVSILNGAPGVLSARYAGEPKSDAKNIKKLLEALKDEDNRKARFKTVIALNMGHEKILFQGIVNGEITHTPSGDSGFGYDPVFKPENHEKTFAEISILEKNKISHRANAIRQLVDYLRT